MSQITNRNTVDIKLPTGGRITIGSRVKPTTHGVSSVIDPKIIPTLSPKTAQSNIIIGNKNQDTADKTLSIITKPRVTPVQIIESGPTIVLPDLSQQIKAEMTKLDALEIQIDELEKSITSQKNILHTQVSPIVETPETASIPDISTSKITILPQPTQEIVKDRPMISTPMSLLNSPKQDTFSSNSMLYLALSGFCLALMPVVFLTLPKTSLIINSFLLLLVVGFFYGFKRAKFLEARANLKDQMYESLQQILDQKSSQQK